MELSRLHAYQANKKWAKWNVFKVNTVKNVKKRIAREASGYSSTKKPQKCLKTWQFRVNPELEPLPPVVKPICNSLFHSTSFFIVFLYVSVKKRNLWQKYDFVIVVSFYISYRFAIISWFNSMQRRSQNVFNEGAKWERGQSCERSEPKVKTENNTKFE